MDRTVMVKVGDSYVTADGSLSTYQSDALRIVVPQNADGPTPQARVVTLKVRS